MLPLLDEGALACLIADDFPVRIRSQDTVGDRPVSHWRLPYRGEIEAIPVLALYPNFFSPLRI